MKFSWNDVKRQNSRVSTFRSRVQANQSQENSRYMPMATSLIVVHSFLRLSSHLPSPLCCSVARVSSCLQVMSVELAGVAWTWVRDPVSIMQAVSTTAVSIKAGMSCSARLLCSGR